MLIAVSIAGGNISQRLVCPEELNQPVLPLQPISCAYRGYDLYVLFVERGSQILKRRGLWGMNPTLDVELAVVTAFDVVGERGQKWFVEFEGVLASGGQLAKLPIRIIAPNDNSGREKRDQIADLVERIIDVSTQMPKAKTDHARIVIQRQVDAADGQIDQLVYGLTEAKIAIVESATTSRVALAADMMSGMEIRYLIIAGVVFVLLFGKNLPR